MVLCTTAGQMERQHGKLHGRLCYVIAVNIAGIYWDRKCMLNLFYSHSAILIINNTQHSSTSTTVVLFFSSIIVSPRQPTCELTQIAIVVLNIASWYRGTWCTALD